MDFTLLKVPKVVFGIRKINTLQEFLSDRNHNILLLTGNQSLQSMSFFPGFLKSLDEYSSSLHHEQVSEEPAVELIDNLQAKYRLYNINLIIAIGGGSVIDTGKALSVMLVNDNSIENFLEGIGSQKVNGQKIKCITIPTTAGTGSEVTANAVISKVGLNGFKRSIRHDSIIPDIALIDPQLTLTCPKSVTIGSGLDALTQLIESFLSKKSSIFTDSLIKEILPSIVPSLIRVSLEQPDDILARERLSYGAFISGICLANAGLGTVHGYASSVGAVCQIPHGIICGKLLTPCIRATVEKVFSLGDEKAIEKICQLEQLLLKDTKTSKNTGGKGLIDFLQKVSSQLKLPNFSEFGLTREMCRSIAEKTDNKNNIVQIDNETKYQILLGAL